MNVFIEENTVGTTLRLELTQMIVIYKKASFYWLLRVGGRIKRYTVIQSFSVFGWSGEESGDTAVTDCTDLGASESALDVAVTTPASKASPLFYNNLPSLDSYDLYNKTFCCY